MLRTARVTVHYLPHTCHDVMLFNIRAIVLVYVSCLDATLFLKTGHEIFLGFSDIRAPKRTPKNNLQYAEPAADPAIYHRYVPYALYIS